YINSKPDMLLWETQVVGEVAPRAVVLAYYILLEGLWGCSLGKRLLRLRVYRSMSDEPPGIGRAFVRTVCNQCLTHVGTWVAAVIMVVKLGPQTRAIDAGFSPKELWLVGLQYAGVILGLAAMCSTIRARNGYRL